MTNEEKYKTIDERAKAYMEFCGKRSCERCEVNVDEGRISECKFRWLALEAEDEKSEPCPFLWRRNDAKTSGRRILRRVRLRIHQPIRRDRGRRRLARLRAA